MPKSMKAQSMPSFLYSSCSKTNISIQASKSMPKSMKAQLMPSLLYSSCSNTNM
ncbi:hypothetical protein O3M35_001119 [Rhynocoris fuscipes]|uniref:Uncharacterized protein n=1 Tax=Rhynocoris fuscipes TaxID=488301 RepID=A0AAW1DP11_9HEMI